MPLTLKADGLNPENLFTSAWVNDFTNLLTGALNDQPVTLNYRPGSGSTPALSLKGDGSGPLVKGFKTDNTTLAFQVDSNGNMTLAGTLTVGGKKAVLSAPGSNFTASDIGVGDLAHRPAAGNKGRIYIETPFS